MPEPVNPDDIAKIESEHAQQVALFAWAALNYEKYPELRLMFAIPNGGERNVIVASNLKAEGVKADVSDIFLPVARGHWHGLFIELKKIKGKKPAGHATPGQLDFIAAVGKQGFAAMVAVGFIAARDALIQYLEWK